LIVTLRSTASRIAPAAFASLVVLAACGSNTSPGTGSAPTVSSTIPADVAVGVPTNAKLFATFSEAMDPASLSAATVLVKQGTTPVVGTVAVGTDNLTLTFTPAASLSASTVFTATITAGANGAAGRALASDHTWSFTTGTTADTTAPVVSGTNPASGGTGVPINAKVTATFDEAMEPASLTTATFVVSQGATPVAGTVSYGTAGTTATFNPASTLAVNALFTATVGTGSKDLAGNALASTHSWTFTTGVVAAKGPALVGLGTAGNYAALAKTAISTVPSSVVTGDIAVSPAAATFLTGFSLAADATNVFSTSPQVVGKAFAADYAVPTPSNLTTAVSNMEAAYTDAAGRPTPDFLELGTGNIGGKTLVPGLYKWTSTVTIPADVVLTGGANDVWIFQTSGDLTMDAAKHVTLSGGAQAKNIFWQVAGKATFGAGSHFEGVVLAKTDVTLVTGATMNGRALSQTQVVLEKATLSQPAP
jgi:hypothetical protein